MNGMNPQLTTSSFSAPSLGATSTKRILALVLALTLPISSASASVVKNLVASEGELLAVDTGKSQLFQVSPQSLRIQLINNGLTIRNTVQRVKQAKLTVEVARGKLLPSLNLGAVMGTIANPAFILSAVEYVIPFILPSRWFDFYKAKNLVEAEKQGFLITELNLYASTLSLAVNMLNDLKVRQILYNEMRDWIAVEGIVRRAVEDNRAVPSDLDRARSQTANVNIRIARLNELLIEEMTELKKILNLGPNIDLQFVDFEVGNSKIEQMDLNEAIKMVHDIAPERAQMVHFINAGKKDKWSKIFAFISGASAGNGTRGLNTNESASFAFGDQVGRLNFNFSYDYFPSILIASSNLEMLRLREQEVRNELTKVTTDLVWKKDFIQDRFDQSQSGAELLERVFASDRQRYSEGQITLIQVFESQRQWRQAILENLRAATDLKLMRVSMDRLIRANEFSHLKGCETVTAYGKGTCKTKETTARFGK